MYFAIDSKNSKKTSGVNRHEGFYQGRVVWLLELLNSSCFIFLVIFEAKQKLLRHSKDDYEVTH